MSDQIEAVVFDIGKVLVRWERDLPFRRLIPDAAARAYFMDTVIPLAWHAEHDAGRGAEEMIAERSAQFPEHAPLIRAWLTQFNESIPGPVPGSPALVEELMKIRNSLKSLKGRHRDNRVIRRRGRTYVINKTNRRFKARQG